MVLLVSHLQTITQLLSDPFVLCNRHQHDLDLHQQRGKGSTNALNDQFHPFQKNSK